MSLPDQNSQLSDIAPNHSDNSDSQQSELLKLRELLLGEEYEQLQDLHDQIKDPERYTDSVANVLSEAIKLRSAKDKTLTSALMPNVEEAIQISVKKDSRPLVEAIFPIIGPAIRKSISEAISSMLKNMNDLVEQSLSVKSIKWRLEAKRTGKSYAEIALLRTLDYQVEQVFLIHRETGLLLHHLVSDRAVINDPDMVSGMLTAIQDFIADSFNVDQGEGLKSMALGELQVFIEQGPRAVIAAVVIGNPPSDLGVTLKEALESIHAELALPLAEYQGDNAPFEEAYTSLHNCLRSQAKEEQIVVEENKKRKWLPWLFAGAAIIVLFYWGISSYLIQRDWTKIVDKLESEPGLIIISKDKTDGQYRIQGLRDPLARSPELVISQQLREKIDIQWDWQPYMSMSQEFILLRAKQLLGEPDRVSIVIKQGVLQVSGVVAQSWIDKLQRRTPHFLGINEIDITKLKSIESYQNEFKQHQDTLNSLTIYFESGASIIAKEESDKLQLMHTAIQGMIINADIIPYQFNVQIKGHTDNAGSEEQNRLLSQARADSVLAEINKQSYKKNLFISQGMGAKEIHSAIAEGKTKSSQLRRVTFKVTILEKSK